MNKTGNLPLSQKRHLPGKNASFYMFYVFLLILENRVMMYASFHKICGISITGHRCITVIGVV